MDSIVLILAAIMTVLTVVIPLLWFIRRDNIAQKRLREYAAAVLELEGHHAARVAELGRAKTNLVDKISEIGQLQEQLRIANMRNSDLALERDSAHRRIEGLKEEISVADAEHKRIVQDRDDWKSKYHDYANRPQLLRAELGEMIGDGGVAPTYKKTVKYDLNLCFVDSSGGERDILVRSLAASIKNKQTLTELVDEINETLNV